MQAQDSAPRSQVTHSLPQWAYISLIAPAINQDGALIDIAFGDCAWAAAACPALAVPKMPVLSDTNFAQFFQAQPVARVPGPRRFLDDLVDLTHALGRLLARELFAGLAPFL